MRKLSAIIMFILFGTIDVRQIGFIANHVYTYASPADNSSITTIALNKTSSCNACICAAFMSTIDYAAINCYKNDNICYLLTCLVNITGMILSPNNFVYILSNVSIPLISGNASISSSSTLATTLSSTASSVPITFIPTTAITGSSTTTKKCRLWYIGPDCSEVHLIN